MRGCGRRIGSHIKTLKPVLGKEGQDICHVCKVDPAGHDWAQAVAEKVLGLPHVSICSSSNDAFPETPARIQRQHHGNYHQQGDTYLIVADQNEGPLQQTDAMSFAMLYEPVARPQDILVIALWYANHSLCF